VGDGFEEFKAERFDTQDKPNYWLQDEAHTRCLDSPFLAADELEHEGKDLEKRGQDLIRKAEELRKTVRQ
jgi:hypothetical protein